MEIQKKDRRCLDKYLIKNFSDNISISDAMRNLSITKNLLYITPDSLMRSWIAEKTSGKRASLGGGSYQPDVHVDDRHKSYEETLKRAFYILKEFYKNVSHKPFYKEYVYYPIYIEKIEKFVPNDKAGIKVMNYSFIILSNDLDSDLKIDEIRYDSNATLNFLFMFAEFFANPLSKDSISSLNDLDNKSLNFIIKFYQFVEKTDKTPIEITLDLYKFLGILNKILDSRSRPSLADVEKEISRYFSKDTKIDVFKKYAPVMKSAFVREISSGRASSDRELFRNAFNKMLETLFDQKGFQDLFGEIRDTDQGLRKSIVYNSNKYQEIISLAEELVKFNMVQTADAIVVEDQVDFDFSLEQGNYGLQFQSQVVSQKYQEYFKRFIDEIRSYITVKIQKSFGIYIDEIETTFENKYSKTTARLRENLRDKEEEFRDLEKELARVQKDLDRFRTIINAPGFDSTTPAGQSILNQENDMALRENAVVTDMHRTQADIMSLTQQLQYLESQINGASTVFKASLKTDFLEEMSASILNHMSSDIAFLYDDLKDLFMSEELVKQQLIASVANSADFNRVLASGDVRLQDLQDFYKTLEIDFETLAETMYNSLYDAFIVYERELTGVAQAFVDSAPNKMQQGFRTKFIDYFTDPANKQKFIETYKQEIKERAIGTVMKLVNRVFEKKRYQRKIEIDKRLSELHPLIKKMLKNPQNFRSFIIDFDTVENLYRLWFIAQTKKFTAGLVGQLPRKLNNPKNRIEFVLERMLGLGSNPVWILSQSKLYLSMPDYLSLTKTKILSNIPKEELQKICRIDAKDYWDENKLGKSANIIGKADTSKEQAKIDAIEEKIKDLKAQEQAAADQTTKQRYKTEIVKKQNELKKAKKELEKAKKKKNVDRSLPNLFTDDYRDEPILSDKEKSELMQHKKDIIPGASLPSNKKDIIPGASLPSNKKDDFEEELAKKMDEEFKDLMAQEKKHEFDRTEQERSSDNIEDIFARRERKDR